MLKTFPGLIYCFELWSPRVMLRQTENENADRQTDRETDRYIDREINRCVNRYIGRCMNPFVDFAQSFI